MIPPRLTVSSSTVSYGADTPASHFNGKIVGLCAIDAVVSAEVIKQLFVDMPQGIDPVSACVTCALSDACVTCPTSKTNITTANTEPVDCGPCQSNSNLDTNGGACICDAGYSGLSCAPCVAGTSKEGAGAMVCEKCPVGQYISVGASVTCSPCPASATTAGTGSMSEHDCVCNAGYSMLPDGPRRACTLCDEAAEYSIEIG